MGYDGLVRLAIQILDDQTESMQEEVLQFPWITDSGFGKVLGSGIARNALVTMMNKVVQLDHGGEITVKAQIIILEQFTDLDGIPGREGPVDPRDEFQLPNGTRGIIVNAPGLVDPTTSKQYFAEIMIG